MKLKIVTVSFAFVLAVEDTDVSSDFEHEARLVAQEAFRAMSPREFDYEIVDYSTDLLPSTWNEECYPYAGGYTKTIKDHLIDALEVAANKDQTT